MIRSLSALQSESDQELTLRVMEPAHRWAHDQLMTLASFMRGEVTVDDLETRVAALAE
jgi:hypothetical protein